MSFYTVARQKRRRVKMNRRHKKKPQTDYLAFIQQKWHAFDWRGLILRVRTVWLALPKLHQRALLAIVPVVCLLIIIPFPERTEQAAVPKSSERVEISINTVGLSEQKTPQQTDRKSEFWREYTVKNGDTLSQVFRANDLPMSDLNALVKIEGSDKPLSQITQGQLVRFKLAADGQLDILQLEKNDQSVMFFRRSDGGFGRSK
ncbi:lysine transporter LysM [Vibrio sp. V09_P4A23P171]|uniref:Lysine transporter LysM n=2 Tax=Vibrio anguillarum TaxID=55601 RepID=A0A241PHL2_VIBAN|nr:lysine transporter LysM [Vibrio anguillarum]MDF9388382.1 lysine transporter LysM [Vibrio sp. 1151_11]OXX37761.1 lysine transporter LysM [Vibrio sp. V09_P4A23P171]MBF4246247.1 lysine transporter LysM [Vibrio anguillarum]MBF4283121.1 lysine transporter LysM [Vibrio anguillarum]